MEGEPKLDKEPELDEKEPELDGARTGCEVRNAFEPKLD
jgi:hypothetical protein